MAAPSIRPWQYQSYVVYTKRCLLWSNEKLQIAIHWGNNIMNKQTYGDNQQAER